MTDMNSPAIRVLVTGAIGTIELCNPARRNAVSITMWSRLASAVQALNSDDGVRVVVLRGAGGEVFCVGADMSEFDGKRSNAKQAAAYTKLTERAYSALEACSKPTVAMIEGPCIGAGLAMAVCCDLRVGGPRSVFSVPAARIGLGYSYENVARLANAVGPSHARDMLLTARRLGVDDALAIGLLHYRLHDAQDDTFTRLLESLVNNAAPSMAASKLALRAFCRPGSPGLLDAAREAVALCSDSKEYAAGRQGGAVSTSGTLPAP